MGKFIKFIWIVILCEWFSVSNFLVFLYYLFCLRWLISTSSSLWRMQWNHFRIETKILFCIEIYFCRAQAANVRILQYFSVLYRTSSCHDCGKYLSLGTNYTEFYTKRNDWEEKNKHQKWCENEWMKEGKKKMLTK